MNKNSTAKLKGMAANYRYWRKPTTKGYNRKGYSWSKSIKGFKKTGYFKTVSNGSGHTAGYEWAKSKNIDPESRARRYSKNSPSFDEGVYNYKSNQKARMMAAKVKTTPPKKQEANV